MTQSIKIPSFAKVNYTLDILSPRPDGYHNLASVFQAISLHDDITLTLTNQSSITIDCNAPGVPRNETNLAWRAVAAALRAVGKRYGVHIQLDKRLPSQAGLGGGSSNAAAALRGVNRLCELGISDERLLELGAELGSDVAFFLVGGAASARGRGEQLTPLDDGPELWFVIVKPDVGVSTGKAYAALDAIPNRQSARATRRMEEALHLGDTDQIIARMCNDFEQVVYEQYLPVALLADDLMMARARVARLCGSGASVYGVARTKEEADEIARIVRLKYTKAYVCRSLTRTESLVINSEEIAY